MILGAGYSGPAHDRGIVEIIKINLKKCISAKHHGWRTEMTEPEVNKEKNRSDGRPDQGVRGIPAAWKRMK
jgi:hypothetical protein